MSVDVPRTPPPRRLALVHIGRSGALGNRNRLQTWQSLGEVTGADVTTVDLAATPARPRDLRRVVRLLDGSIVPEALTWSGAALRARLSSADTVVFISARAVDPALVPSGATVVLDFVDRLSESYRLRRGLASSTPSRLLFAGLAPPMRRFEALERPHVVRVAAGRGDAAVLGAQWLPNLLSGATRRPATAPTTDLLFHGNLRYPPNEEAVLCLRQVWPDLRSRRPATTLTIAGARPREWLARLVAETPGWTLLPDFRDLGAVLAAARVAVAPVLSATGLQNKALESAAAGLPTVVTPAVASGFDPAFPFVVTDLPGLAATVVELLDDGARLSALEQAGPAHVERHYTARSWRESGLRLLGGPQEGPATGRAAEVSQGMP